MTDQLKKAIQLRKDSKPKEALEILKGLLLSNPNDPQICYQVAWTYDVLGNESEAVSFYEKAIASGLLGDDLKGAMLGLGSTYRCLGKYDKSLVVFDKAIEEFPEDRSLKTFRALTLYNLGQYQEAVVNLLVQLLDTTGDENIKTYEEALRLYSGKLDEIWK